MSSFSLPNRTFTQIYNNNHKTESVLLILTYHILTINFTNEVLHGLSNINGSILLLAIQKTQINSILTCVSSFILQLL